MFFSLFHFLSNMYIHVTILPTSSSIPTLCCLNPECRLTDSLFISFFQVFLFLNSAPKPTEAILHFALVFHVSVPERSTEYTE